MDGTEPESFTEIKENDKQKQPERFRGRNARPPSYDAVGLAAWLKRSMREKGRSQAEIAARSGLGKATVNRIADGKGTASAMTIRRVAEAAGGSVLEALAAAGVLADLADDVEARAVQLAAAFLSLSEHDRQILEAVAEAARRA